jgi:hypothetical protein
MIYITQLGYYIINADMLFVNTRKYIYNVIYLQMVIGHFVFLPMRLSLSVPEKAQNRFCRDIASVEWMLQRHAAHDKCAPLDFACGEQRSAAAPRPAKCRCHYTLRGFFSFFSENKVTHYLQTTDDGLCGVLVYLLPFWCEQTLGYFVAAFIVCFNRGAVMHVAVGKRGYQSGFIR